MILLDKEMLQYYSEEISKIFVKQETGKGLSANDFTDDLKAKVENIDKLQSIKGRVDTISDLPQDPKTGDIYYVGPEGSKTFDVMLWGGTKWNKLLVANIDATTYASLADKPQIEGVALEGNKTAADLGIAKVSDVVTLTGNQTIAGDKTFESVIVKPSTGSNKPGVQLQSDEDTGVIIKTADGNTTRSFIGHVTANGKEVVSFVNSYPAGSFLFNKSIKYKTGITPTDDDDLASKKYVDDQIVSAGGMNQAEVEKIIASKAVLLEKPQSIEGVKTFTSVPKTDAVPTADNDLVNIKYIKDNYTPASKTDIDEIIKAVF